MLNDYTMMGRPVDVVETSRGCTFDCGFCSIIEMRGRNFHTYTFDRVLADIRDARDHGARAIFIVDDNISLNIKRFEALCQAIIDAGLNDIVYTVQAMTSPIAMHGDTLAPLMRKAGFRYVFLGIENILEDDLQFLKAAAKNEFREAGRKTGNATLRAIDYLHKNKMYVVGGLIVGNPDDTRESIHANLEFAREYVDWPYIQHPTPYPGTPMTKDFRARNLIKIDRLEEYDGTTAVVATQHLQPEEIEFRTLALRALDEDPAYPSRDRPRSAVRSAQLVEDAGPHFPRKQRQIGPWTGKRSQSLRTLSRYPQRRTRLSLIQLSRSPVTRRDLFPCLLAMKSRYNLIRSSFHAARFRSSTEKGRARPLGRPCSGRMRQSQRGLCRRSRA